MSEWDSIISLGKMHTSYGTCVTTTSKHKENIEKHYLEENDTLQGIALKYSSTTEEIRRMNKLFFSESIFQRMFLLVPSVPEKQNESIKGENNVTDSSPTEKPQRKVVEKLSKTETGTTTQAKTDDTSQSVHDFLKNMDSQILASKQATKDITKKELNIPVLDTTERQSNSEYYKVIPNHTTRPNLDNCKYQEEMFQL